MKRQNISSVLRKLRILYLSDWLRFYLQKFENRKVNKHFKTQNPNINLPPDYMIYESFRINYQRYYTESKESSEELVSRFRKHIDLDNKKILDWGCGPGRIIRHLPEIIGNNCEFYGSDYNKKTIAWNKKNIKGVHFNNNDLNAILPYEDNFFDVIYGLSVLTHLSKQLHFDWFEELCRVLKKGGILFLTTQGDNFRNKLTSAEIERYDINELIVRGNVLEGHRTYSAFHPKKFMHKLFKKVEILEHIELPIKEGWIPQDIWIIRKK